MDFHIFSLLLECFLHIFKQFGEFNCSKLGLNFHKIVLSNDRQEEIYVRRSDDDLTRYVDGYDERENNPS